MNESHDDGNRAHFYGGIRGPASVLSSRAGATVGLDFSRVVQVRCYLQNQSDWDAHNRIYREFFSPPYPARTTLVGCLGDLAKYEVDLVAYTGGDTIAPPCGAKGT